MMRETRKICAIIAVLCMITLVSCTTTPTDIAMPAPPGELLILAPPLDRLDDSKPMSVRTLAEQAAKDAGQYRNVANTLARLQFFLRAHCNCITAAKPAPVAMKATKPPALLVAALKAPEPESEDLAELPSDLMIPPAIQSELE